MVKSKMLDAMSEYERIFDDGFPSYPFISLGEERIIEIIYECIEKNKDPYELGYLSLDRTY